MSPNPRKPHSSPALASGQICLPSPFPAATEISSKESEELEDQLSRVIHFLVLTELPCEPNSLSPHKGGIQMLGAQAPSQPCQSLVATL